MSRYKKNVPEVFIGEGIQVPDNLKKQPLEEILYLVDTAKLNVKYQEEYIAIMDFWCYCDSLLSLKWYRTYSKLRGMGYTFQGYWFRNPSKSNSFYITPVDAQAAIDTIERFAMKQVERLPNPFVNSEPVEKEMADYLFAIQYFQAELVNCDRGMLLSVFDKDDTYFLSVEQVDLVNNALERKRTIKRRV